MADIWQLLIHSNTINFLLVVALIVFIFVKLNIKEKLEILRSEIKCYVDDAQNEKNRADENLNKAKGKVVKLPLIIERIEKSAAHNVENIAHRIELETQDQKLDIEKNAARLLNLETKKFNQKLVSILSEKSVDIAKQNAIEKLSSNPELHNIYIENAIDEIGRVDL